MPDGAAALVRCSKCGESKLPSEFYRNARRSSGLTVHCKPCCKEAARRWLRRIMAANAAMTSALQRIVSNVYERDGVLTAETAEICGRIARAALEGEAE